MQLAERGLPVSFPQVERWRSAGILPSNERHGLGRGRGSTSATSQDALLLAEAMALAVRPGRPLHEAVLRIFAVNPRVGQDFIPTTRLPLPEKAVRAALEWYLRNRSINPYERIRRAVAKPATEEAAEDIAETVARDFCMTIYRRQRRRARHGIYVPDLGRFEGEEDAEATAALMIAKVLDTEALGVERYYDAVRASFPRPRASDPPSAERQYRWFLASFEEERVRARSLELAGEPLDDETVDGELTSTSAEIECLQSTDFATICRMRDVLAYLGHGAAIFQAARQVIPNDPEVRHLEQAVAKSARVEYYLHTTAGIARTLAPDAWRLLTPLLTGVCADRAERDQLGRVCAAIDPALDDPLGMAERTLTAWRARAAADANAATGAVRRVRP
jgi:hypothetical protein